MLLFISGPEIFLIVLVVLLLFGSKKIPEMARGMGKGMREFKRATDEIKSEINNSSSDIMNDVRDIQKEIDKQEVDSDNDDPSEKVNDQGEEAADSSVSSDSELEKPDLDENVPGNSGYPDEDLNESSDHKSRE